MPRATTTLNDPQLRTAKPSGKEYVLTDINGLGLRIRPDGSKDWIFRYQRPHTAKRAKLSLGSYTGGMTLKQARDTRDKYLSLFASLALTIHAVDSSPGGDIRIQSANKALSWCEYLESHARRVYALVDGPIGSAVALEKRLRDMPNPFRIGAINNRNWHGLTTTDQVHEALDKLCEHGHLQKVVSGTTRPATDYFKHPDYCNG